MAAAAGDEDRRAAAGGRSVSQSENDLWKPPGGRRAREGRAARRSSAEAARSRGRARGCGDLGRGSAARRRRSRPPGLARRGVRGVVGEMPLEERPVQARSGRPAGVDWSRVESPIQALNACWVQRKLPPLFSRRRPMHPRRRARSLANAGRARAGRGGCEETARCHRGCAGRRPGSPRPAGRQAVAGPRAPSGWSPRPAASRAGGRAARGPAG